VPTFITPPEFSGSAALTSTTGLTAVETGLWLLDPPAWDPGETWAVSLTHPSPLESGLLHLRAENWPVVGGTELTAWTDPETHITYGPELCRIEIRGRWIVPRLENSNSYNSFGVIYSGLTQTDQGSRTQGPWLLNYQSDLATYTIQGSGVEGGAQNTFEDHVFECRITQGVSTDNSNRLFQSNAVTTPVWQYHYSRSWQID